MSSTTTPLAAPPRWLEWITTLAILAPAPYALSRLLWAAGIPFGIDSQLLHDDFQAPGWGSLQILLLAGLCEATALYASVFLRDRTDRIPSWTPLLGGRPVRPSLVVLPLLAPIAILVGFDLWTLGPIADGFTIPKDNAGLPAWSFWGQVATFWIWGISLTIATTAYWWRARGSHHVHADDRRNPVTA